MTQTKTLIALCVISLMASACAQAPSGLISALEDQAAKNTDQYTTGYDALIRHKEIEAGYIADWDVVSDQGISVQYKNNENTPITVKVTDFKMVKNNVAVNIVSSGHFKNRDAEGVYKGKLNYWHSTINKAENPPIYVIPAKSNHLVSVSFDNWPIGEDGWFEESAPKKGDIVTLDIPVGDKVFHIKSKLE
jgi:hypothetical protein